MSANAGTDASFGQAKQQAIIADMGKIYEIGSIFRAENSNTARHLTEFVGMDLEMAIDTDYHECMNVIDGVLKKIFKGVQERNKKELEVVKQRFPHQDLVIPDKTVILHYKEGVQLLRDAGHKHEDGSEIQDDEDFDTPTEKRLGAIVKEKYNTDYYILDKFPTGVRPFYTMPDPTDERYSNSFDIFVRGQEILSGGQRVHDSAMLEAKMKDSGMDPEMLSEYIHAFRLGAPPHAGGGVGLDRLIMLMLKLDNIRFASLYPRDPKSFPDSGKPPPAPRPKIGRHGTLPDISSLIAAYGDSTNTSWLDPRYTIWRHLETGAAIGYVPAKHNYGIIWGAPLCAPEDMDQVMHAWLEHCDQIKLKPIWCCVDQHTAELLSARYRWKAVSCIAEARVDPKHYLGNEESNVPKKIQGAKKAGVKVTALEGEPTDELRKELDAQIKEWQSHREGTQMHISDVSAEALTKDSKHKRFLLAKDADGKLAGIVVLAKLSPQHGEQIKWSLQFPDAPNGTSEYMLSEAMKSAMELGVASLT
jgi:elongation factor P--beta-lysine ligase